MLVTERQDQEGSLALEHEGVHGPFFEYLTRTADGFMHRGTVFILFNIETSNIVPHECR
jgi:hypothetical protein